MGTEQTEGEPGSISPQQDMTAPVRVHSQVGSPPPAGVPFSFLSLLEIYKRVVMHPRVETFDAELPAANWQAIWAGAGIWAAAWAIFGSLAALINRSPYASGPTFSSVLGGLVGVFLVLVAGFFFGVAVLQFVARRFSGTASYRTYAYALSLALVAVNVIAAVGLIIPVLGGLIFLAAEIYGFYLAVLATRSAHRVATGTAWVIMIIPSVACAVLSFLFSFLLSFLLVALSLVGH